MSAPACPAGVHDTREECDLDPWCPADDPTCFGTRCDDHQHCHPDGSDLRRLDIRLAQETREAFTDQPWAELTRAQKRNWVALRRGDIEWDGEPAVTR